MATRVEPRPAPTTGAPRQIRIAALGVLLVAVAYLAVALARGGYSPGFQAGLAAVTWWTAMVGLAFGALPRQRVPSAALAAGTALAGFALLVALSAGWASDDGRVLPELVRVSAYLGVFTLVVLTCGRGGGRPWLFGLAVALGVVAAVALGSRLFPTLFPEQDLGRFLPTSRARLSYPVNYWNGLAAIMAAALVVLAWSAGNARTMAGRALATAALPLPPAVIFLASSRGGALAAIVGLVVLVVAARERLAIAVSILIGLAGGALTLAEVRSHEVLVDGPFRGPVAEAAGEQAALVVVLVAIGAAAVRLLADVPLRKIELQPLSHRISAAVAAGVVAVALVAGLAAGVPDRLERFTDPPGASALPKRGLVESHFASDSGSGRFQFWESGWSAFEREPLKGLGAGGYQAWWLRTGSLPYAIRDAHSLFVESAAELGVAGLMLLAVFFGTVAVAGVRRRLRPGGDHSVAGAALALIAAGLLAAAIDWTWELPAAFVLVVIAAALLTGPATAAKTPERGRYGWGWAILGVGFAALFASAMLLVGQAKLSDSREAARAGDLGQAVEDAEAAERVAPWASAPRLQQALVAERAGNLRQASLSIDEAIERAPDDWRLWLAAARIRTRQGDVPGGARALARARSLNPRSPIFREVRR